MMACMKEFFPEQVTWIIPKGGMFIWASLPEKLDAYLLLERAMAQNVLFVPGQNFYVEAKQGTHSLRMNFSNPSKEEIRKGITIMGNLIKEMMFQ